MGGELLRGFSSVELLNRKWDMDCDANVNLDWAYFYVQLTLHIRYIRFVNDGTVGFLASASFNRRPPHHITSSFEASLISLPPLGLLTLWSDCLSQTSSQSQLGSTCVFFEAWLKILDATQVVQGNHSFTLNIYLAFLGSLKLSWDHNALLCGTTLENSPEAAECSSLIGHWGSAD